MRVVAGGLELSLISGGLRAAIAFAHWGEVYGWETVGFGSWFGWDEWMFGWACLLARWLKEIVGRLGAIIVTYK